MLKEAYDYLGTYIATGLVGFWQKAVDRMTARGIRLDGWTPSIENAQKLREFLLTNHTI